jgi:hypothetical protein
MIRLRIAEAIVFLATDRFRELAQFSFHLLDRPTTSPAQGTGDFQLAHVANSRQQEGI